MAARRTTKPNTSAPNNGTTRRTTNRAPRMAAYDGIYRSSFRYPQYSMDELLAQKGWQVPEDMLTMGACRAPFNLLRYAVQAQGWEVVPAVTDPADNRAEEAKVYADFIRYVLTNMRSEAGLVYDFRKAIFEIDHGCWDGFRVAEKLTCQYHDGPYADKIGLYGFAPKKAKQIGFDIDPRTEEVLYITSYTPGGSSMQDTRTKQFDVSGGYDFTVPVDRCVLRTHDIDGNDPHGNGIWRPVYKHWFRLDNNLRFWAIALERWGAPCLITEGDTNNALQMEAIVTAMAELRAGGDAIVPKGVKYSLATAPVGVFDSLYKCCQYDGEQIALAIQANTLTSSEGQRVGSLSLGEVHQDTGDTIYDFIRDDTEAVFETQVFDWLLRLNYAAYDSSLCPTLSLGKDEVGDKLVTAQALQILVDMGNMSSKSKIIRREMGYEPLDEDEEAMIEQEKKADQEAQSRLADARNTNAVPALDKKAQEKAMQILRLAALAQIQTSEEAA